MTMVCIRCRKRWTQVGRWPHKCPYCPSNDIRPVTPLSEELVGGGLP